MNVAIAPNKMRLGRLSRAGPPHLSAPEISHSSFVHSLVWWHPGPVPTLALCGRLQMASLIRRTVPRCPIHCCADGIPLPCQRQPRSILTKTPKPSNICSLCPPLLGCMRERRTLFNLLHEYWSRSPNLLPVSRSLSAPQQSSSLPIYGTH